MNPTPETHVFIGMFRPPLSEIWQMFRDIDPCFYKRPGAMMLPAWDCGGEKALMDDYMRGHFDSPQYATREEIIDRIARSPGTAP